METIELVAVRCVCSNREKEVGDCPECKEIVLERLRNDEIADEEYAANRPADNAVGDLF